MPGTATIGCTKMEGSSVSNIIFGVTETACNSTPEERSAGCDGIGSPLPPGMEEVTLEFGAKLGR
jgi:hypothetical protein